MRTVIIYRDSDDYFPAVRTWLADFSRSYPDKEIEEFSPDDPKADDLIRVHDVNRFPAIVALDDEGKIVSQWMDILPKLADVAYYSAEKREHPGLERFDANISHKVIEPPSPSQN